MCIYSFFNHLFVVSFFVVVFVLTKTVNYFKKKFNSKFMNIYEKEIYSNLILTIEHFTFYKKKYVFRNLVEYVCVCFSFSLA